MPELLQSLSIIFALSLAPTYLAAQSSWHFTAADVNALHSKPADYRLAYGKGIEQFGELRLPQGSGPFPVAIIIHGGCWVAKFADLHNTAALADALRAEGIATWNIEYSREDSKGGAWPGTFEDVGHAADFLRTIAGKYSLDLNRVLAIGHSAGGQLALWLAARHRLERSSILYMPQPLKLQGVIAMGGVPDLKAFREHGKMVCESDVVGKLLGKSSQEINQHYKDASPSELLPLGLPQVLIYGTEDFIVPASFGKSYLQKAGKKGDQVRLINVKLAGHHEYNAPNSVAWTDIKSSVLSLL